MYIKPVVNGHSRVYKNVNPMHLQKVIYKKWSLISDYLKCTYYVNEMTMQSSAHFWVIQFHFTKPQQIPFQLLD